MSVQRELESPIPSNVSFKGSSPSPSKDLLGFEINQLRKLSVLIDPPDPKDENPERGNWSNPVEFVLSCLGYIVGLGNIWRFPYLVYRNGGGAFFIAYFTLLVTSGLPMVLMELTIGQHTSQGALTVWEIVPLFKGIGMSMVLLSFFCIIYYCIITGFTTILLTRTRC